MRCADAGADMVRITVQGMQEAKACGKIRDRLFQKGCVCGDRLALSQPLPTVPGRLLAFGAVCSQHHLAEDLLGYKAQDDETLLRQLGCDGTCVNRQALSGGGQQE